MNLTNRAFAVRSGVFGHSQEGDRSHILVLGRRMSRPMGRRQILRRKGWEKMDFPMISYRQLDQWLEQGRPFMTVDLRDPREYARGRIWGSVNIPYEELSGRIGELPKEYALVFVCDRGAKSMLACRDLSRMGFQCVDLAGGMANYRGKFIDRTRPGAIE